MKVVYTIGPYRAPTSHGIVQNIRRAEALSIQLWGIGLAVICPHKNTSLLEGAISDPVVLAGDLEILRRCDVAVCVEGWQNSVGSLAEIKACGEWGIPVFYSISEVANWLQEGQDE